MKRLLKHAASDKVHTITLERAAASDDAFEARIDDRTVSVAVTWLDDASGWFRMGGRLHRFHVTRLTDGAGGERVQVWLDGRTYQFETSTPSARRSGATKEAGAATNQVAAPMPGTILQIRGAVGDHFDAHAPIIVMESMKMELSLSAPAAVRLTSIECRVGELVDMGRVLARLEPAGDD